ncbi:glycosyltransferase family protein [Cellulophaga baltica]|uniref:hypothetical protein n=1 Tax=Cellulophaga baltica TaxID=76594 RepID=UPI0004066EC1|nr:hypothetical protein [Cellulophaga baltica]WFO17298.1 hypothetical protein M601_006155 [Cellulophaga baltica 4]
MSKEITPIVIIAYNRPKSLSRILKSISQAKYNTEDIPLIISIDYSDKNKDVLQIANDFNWSYGEKIINYNPKNLGLRKHVLQCGDIALEYGSVILLEDDLYVSPNFYQFTEQSLAFCTDKANIGGISLYNHKYNVHKGVNFSPIEDGYDNWYFQFASSWGQAWTKDQWLNFREWYETKGILKAKDSIPDNVTSWSEKSWLKYFIVFLIEKNKYFLYPKIALSTNFSDTGTHAEYDSTSYQVPLLVAKDKKYNFSTIKESKGVYNSFYENINISKYLNIAETDLTVNLNDYKINTKTKFLLTTRQLDFKIISSFGRSLKPIEMNIINKIEGNEIFLYNLDETAINKFTDNKVKEIYYNLKIISFENVKTLFFAQIKTKIFKYFSK